MEGEMEAKEREIVHKKIGIKLNLLKGIKE